MTIFESTRGTDRFAIVPGAAEVGWLPNIATDRMVERRSAIAELGAPLRRLRSTAAATEQSPEDVLSAARQLSAIVDRMETGPQRQREEPPSVDDLAMGVRMYNPVWGTDSPLAPPVEFEVLEDCVVGRCNLDLSYEGPPSFAHGGVSAMLLDQVLAMAVAVAGHPAVTRRLEIGYRRPVPLQVSLEIRSAEVRVTDGEIVAVGEIASQEQVLVRGEGRFAVFRPDQVRRFLAGPRGFASITGPSSPGC